MANYVIDLTKAKAGTGYFTVEGTGATSLSADTETTWKVENPANSATKIATVKDKKFTAEGTVVAGLAITGKSVNVTSITGSEKDDIINVTGVQKIDAGEGADQITISKGTVSVTTGSGADSVFVTGGKAIIADAAENDVIAVTSGTALLGTDQKISLTGGALTGTENGFTVTADATIDGQKVAKDSTITENGELKLAMGSTFKGVSLSAGAATADLTTGVITAGDDGLTATASQTASIKGGAGSDNITVTGGTVSINGAGAGDVVAVTGGAADLGNGISLTSGTLNFTAAKATADDEGVALVVSKLDDLKNIELGEGADTISVTGSFTKAEVVKALASSNYVDGTDKIVLGTAGVNKTDSLTNDDATADIANATLANDSVTYNGSTLALGDSGYYSTVTAKGKDGAPDTIAAFAGSYGADLDFSNGTAAYAVNTAINGDEADVVTGGRNKDTILAGSNDTVNGSRGGDIVKFADGATNVVLGLTEKEDTVNVTGFKTGFEDEAGTIALDSTVADNIKFTTYGDDLVITGHGTTVKFNDVSLKSGTAVDLKVDSGDKAGAQYYEVVSEAGELDTLASYVYGVSGNTTNKLRLADNASADYTLEMSNGHYFSDSRTYANINYVDASAATGNVALLGTTDTRSTLRGGAGNTTLFGGGKSDDLLIAEKGDTNFYYGSGNGRDTIQGYKYQTSTTVGDVVNLTNGDLISTTRKGDRTTMTFDPTGDSAADVLTIQSASTDSIQKLRYTYHDGVDTRVQIGQTSSKNVFSYDADTDIYYGGTKSDAIEVTGSEDVTIALDGSTIGNLTKNVSYTENINTLDAQTATGAVALYGAKGNDTIRGSHGDSTLFGGAGDDVLYGNTDTSSYITSFFFGTGCGNDTIAASNSDDKVMLYNATSDEFDEANSTASGTGLTLALTDGSTLTIKKYRTGVNTFVFSDGVVKTYDASTKKWANA